MQEGHLTRRDKKSLISVFCHGGLGLQNCIWRGRRTLQTRWDGDSK